MSNKQLHSCFVSVDCTDCPINEPRPFSVEWYSHKTSSAGVRYEIAVSLQTSQIVWANGPYACGANPDVTIFRSDLKTKLHTNEFVVTDSGYGDEKCITPPGSNHSDHKVLAEIRARHEIMNKRLKQFFILSHRFRHALEQHVDCFHAVCNLTQLNLEHEPLFYIAY